MACIGRNKMDMRNWIRTFVIGAIAPCMRKLCIAPFFERFMALKRRSEMNTGMTGAAEKSGESLMPRCELDVPDV